MKARLIVFLILILIITPTLAQVSIALGARLLKQGMRGTDVLTLQEGLQSIGFQLEVDGIFGPETDAIVRKFQGSQNLMQDGIVGPDTFKAFYQAIDRVLIYFVEAGDTLYDIAQQYQVSLEEIIELNGLGLTSSLIVPGQMVLVPRNDFVSTKEYVVKNGENLSVIAKKFGLSASDIASFNQIKDVNKIRAGQSLAIPVVTVTATAQALFKPDFIWPVSGPISSPYGWRPHPITNTRHFHGGIDIAVSQGTIVRAAAAGRVIEAGWMGDYGYGVVIDHGSG